MRTKTLKDFYYSTTPTGTASNEDGTLLQTRDLPGEVQEEIRNLVCEAIEDMNNGPDVNANKVVTLSVDLPLCAVALLRQYFCVGMSWNALCKRAEERGLAAKGSKDAAYQACWDASETMMELLEKHEVSTCPWERLPAELFPEGTAEARSEALDDLFDKV